MIEFTRLPLLTSVIGVTMVFVSSQMLTSEPKGPPDRVEVGQKALVFELESVDGEPHSLERLRGEASLVLIFFRGTW